MPTTIISGSQCLFFQSFLAANIVSDIAVFVLKRDVKLQLTNLLPMKCFSFCGLSLLHYCCLGQE